MHASRHYPIRLRWPDFKLFSHSVVCVGVVCVAFSFPLMTAIQLQSDIAASYDVILDVPPAIPSGLRVALIGVAPSFGERVRSTIDRETDILVVAEYCDMHAVRTEKSGGEANTENYHADVVITGLSSFSESISPTDSVASSAELLAAYPNARIIAITCDHDKASASELNPHLTPLGDICPAALVDVIRQGASNRAMWNAFL